MLVLFVELMADMNVYSGFYLLGGVGHRTRVRACVVIGSGVLLCHLVAVHHSIERLFTSEMHFLCLCLFRWRKAALLVPSVRLI